MVKVIVLDGKPELVEQLSLFKDRMLPAEIVYVKPDDDPIDGINQAFVEGSPLVVVDGRMTILDVSWLDKLITPLLAGLGSIAYAGPVKSFYPETWSEAIHPFCIAVHPDHWVPLNHHDPRMTWTGSVLWAFIQVQSGKPLSAINIPVMIRELDSLDKDRSVIDVKSGPLDELLSFNPMVSGPAKTVTAVISSKNRRTTTLPQAVMGILMQTRRPEKLVIYDDSDEFPKDLLTTEPWSGILKLAQSLNVEWYYLPGNRQGQVSNHQESIRNCTTDLIWRVDDDNVPEPDVLFTLINDIQPDDVGAVASLVHVAGCVHGHYSPLHSPFIADVATSLNVQWSSRSESILPVEHLHNSFLFRRGAAQPWIRGLSPVGHREETIFTHNMVRAGWRLLVDTRIITWHLRSGAGGIRSFQNHSYWEQDEAIFKSLLQVWGIKETLTKLIVLDCGLGDHYAFLQVWDKIREHHPNRKWILAVCHPDVFEIGQDAKLISIAEAGLICNVEDFNVYRWMAKVQWAGQLADAFFNLYA